MADCFRRLGIKGLLESEVLPVIRPHTPEWFSALEVWNPPQAMMTKACIAAMVGEPYEKLPDL